MEHEYRVPYKKKTRWNARTNSNGRFPGFGVVQSFGGMFRVMSRHGTKAFDTEQEVFDYLKELTT